MPESEQQKQAKIMKTAARRAAYELAKQEGLRKYRAEVASREGSKRDGVTPYSIALERRLSKDRDRTLSKVGEVSSPQAGIADQSQSDVSGGREQHFIHAVPLHANNMSIILQRETVTGGWRESFDPIWKKNYYFNPTTRISSWDVREVLFQGGLEDLLINQQWHLGAVGTAEEGYQKDPNWALEVWPQPFDPKIPPHGEPMYIAQQGRLLVMMDLNPETHVAKILMPHIFTKEEAAKAKELMDLCDVFHGRIGYVKIYSMDGKPLVKNIALDDRGTALPGPFIADFPEAVLLPLQEDQDIESDDVAYVRGGDLIIFQLVAGIRARVATVPKLKGQPVEEGWVTVLLPDGKPLFREQTERDRLVKANRIAKGSPKRVMSMSSSDKIDLEAEQRKVRTAADGFVLRWQDRVRLKADERERLGVVMADSDHYMEHVLRDVQVRKIVDMPYEKGKHRSYR